MRASYVRGAEMDSVVAEGFFAVGGLKFKKFSELYENIKGRTEGFQKPCEIIYNGRGLGSFYVKYEKTKNLKAKERFVIELTAQEMMTIKMIKEPIDDLKLELPKFHRIGCSGSGFVSEQRYYGYINLK